MASGTILAVPREPPAAIAAAEAAEEPPSTTAMDEGTVRVGQESRGHDAGNGDGDGTAEDGRHRMTAPVERPFSSPRSDGLTPAEAAAIREIAGRSKAWSYADICRLVKALKKHHCHGSGSTGSTQRDWDAIYSTSGLTTKTKVQAIKFNSNFKQCHGPILQYLQQPRFAAQAADGWERDGEDIVYAGEDVDGDNSSRCS